MPWHFDPLAYGAAAAWLLDGRLPALGPGRPNEAASDRLNALSLDQLFPQRILVDVDAARCCLAGQWLWHDFLDESHRLSQEIDSPEGSYWHGIMHRREPDYGNAKYWFRRVGSHPVDVLLGEAAHRLAAGHVLDGPSHFLASGTWDHFRFVDLCESVARGQSQAADLARRIAVVQWQLLFVHCYRQAVGEPINAFTGP